MLPMLALYYWAQGILLPQLLKDQGPQVLTTVPRKRALSTLFVQIISHFTKSSTKVLIKTTKPFSFLIFKNFFCSN
jgi:hypothetical protein